MPIAFGHAGRALRKDSYVRSLRVPSATAEVIGCGAWINVRPVGYRWRVRQVRPVTAGHANVGITQELRDSLVNACLVVAGGALLERHGTQLPDLLLVFGAAQWEPQNTRPLP